MEEGKTMGQETTKKVIVTGNQGYIGSVLCEELHRQGYEVVGVDAGIFADRVMSEREAVDCQIIRDVRDVEIKDLVGGYAVMHLAGLSNDPLGELDAALTRDINYRASVRLAEVAKAANVKRFLFSSSCSMYGASGGDEVDEEGDLDPRTVYAKSKALVEEDLRALTDGDFIGTCLRNATVFGYSPRLRLDLVVNNLTASGYLDETVEVLSDGTPWRPNLHVRDCANAFIHLMEAPAEQVRGRSFNVGTNDSNMQVKEIAGVVAGELEGARVKINSDNSPDERTYRVNFDRLAGIGWQGKYTVGDGVRELLGRYLRHELTSEQFRDKYWHTLQRYQELIEEGVLDEELRVREKDKAIT